MSYLTPIAVIMHRINELEQIESNLLIEYKRNPYHIRSVRELLKFNSELLATLLGDRQMLETPELMQ